MYLTLLYSFAGSYTEIMYSLLTFGIPSNLIPVNSDGSIKVDAHLERLEKRKKFERDYLEGKATLQDQVTIIPGPFDILLGRGKMSQENVGNMRYRDVIQSYEERYERARKSEKTQIAAEVVQSIKKGNGRFLKEHYGDFIEIPDSRAREKVSHSFRSLRQNQMRKNQREELGSIVSDDSGTSRSRASRSVGSRSIGSRSRGSKSSRRTSHHDSGPSYLRATVSDHSIDPTMLFPQPIMEEQMPLSFKKPRGGY